MAACFGGPVNVLPLCAVLLLKIMAFPDCLSWGKAFTVQGCRLIQLILMNLVGWNIFGISIQAQYLIRIPLSCVNPLYEKNS